TPDTIRKMKIKAKKEEKSPHWKGDNVGYTQLHTWIKKRKLKSILCENCKEKPPHDLANISPVYNPVTYTRDLKHWEWLCRSCHMKKDGRLDYLHKNNIGRRKYKM